MMDKDVKVSNGLITSAVCSKDLEQAIKITGGLFKTIVIICRSYTVVFGKYTWFFSIHVSKI
jgi:hypothetical protein